MKKTIFLSKPLLLLIAIAFLSLPACKKGVETGGATGGKSIDSKLLGKWGWYSFHTRLFDEAGAEYETPPPFHYGSDDAQNDYKEDGTYILTTDTNDYLRGTWSIKNGKLVQDGTNEYEYSFEDNNRTLILKKTTYIDQDGTRYHKEEYTKLSRDWLPD
jgi:hypothetical protein